jgi:hypothetical protein
VCVGVPCLVSVESGEHADVVANRCDRWADSMTELFAVGTATEVVIAAGACWFEYDLGSPASRWSAMSGWPDALDVQQAAVHSAGVQIVEREGQSAQVLGSGGGDNVDSVGQFVAALADTAGTPAQPLPTQERESGTLQRAPACANTARHRAARPRVPPIVLRGGLDHGWCGERHLHRLDVLSELRQQGG